MSSSSSFYTVFTALLAAFFSTLALAAPTSSNIVARDFTGRATYFEVGLGSCGWTNVDTDYIVALSPSTYAGGVHCGKQITITNSGISATATVVDTCPGCGPDDLDMSPSLFARFQPLAQGVFQMGWNFN
ncbi:hypothetical protein DXG03_003597 [Asterophora parasitica]|uniref:RlpA-like double-psi beta-barrel-protein domain-containing protein-containing protein n=1 Tax=Asterophora parasitica TaxID=117018 RepID=A0A9P7G3G4_9AGAR|nr:hypothetical protein DXG03_003597 [Asterophora parasitica]